MFKKGTACLIVVLLLLTNLLTVPVSAVTNPDEYNSLEVAKIIGSTNVFDLKAKSALLADSKTGKVILEKNSHEKRPIASITKIMSMLLVMEAIDSGKISYDDIVTASDYACSMGGSQAYLAPGEQFTVRDMMKAVAVHSSNDVTVALAEKVAGSEEAFVVLMNEKAKELGMNDTNFLDCTGLTDEGHYSTAYDIMLMTRELINKHPGIFEFTKIIHDTFRNGQFDLDNTNKLIGKYNGANGLKTGYTSKAGYCLSATALRGDMQLIAIVLGEEDTNTRFAEATKLLDYGFANYEVARVCKKDDVVDTVEVKKGTVTKMNGVYAEDVNLLLARGEKNKLTAEPQFESNLTAPIKKGDKIGEVVFKVDDKEVGRTDIVAEKDISKASWIKLFFRMIKGWFSFGK